MTPAIQHILTSAVKVSLGSQDLVGTGDLSEILTIGVGSIEVRELVRTSFYALGIDIEFSGKGIHEKGVVVDIDEDLAAQLGIDPNRLRFGQTVVRYSANAANVDAGYADIENIDNKTTEEIVTAQTLRVLQVLKSRS